MKAPDFPPCPTDTVGRWLFVDPAGGLGKPTVATLWDAGTPVSWLELPHPDHWEPAAGDGDALLALFHGLEVVVVEAGILHSKREMIEAIVGLARVRGGLRMLAACTGTPYVEVGAPHWRKAVGCRTRKVKGRKMEQIVADHCRLFEGEPGAVGAFAREAGRWPRDKGPAIGQADDRRNAFLGGLGTARAWGWCR